MSNQPTADQKLYQVQFAGVGRDGRSWTVQCKSQPNEFDLAQLVKKKKVLMSRYIECMFDDDLEHGVIIAGMRTVGSFRVSEVSL